MKAHVTRASACPQGLQEVSTRGAIVERRISNHGEGEHTELGGSKTGDLPPSGDLDGAENQTEKKKTASA